MGEYVRYVITSSSRHRARRAPMTTNSSGSVGPERIFSSRLVVVLGELVVREIFFGHLTAMMGCTWRLKVVSVLFGGVETRCRFEPYVRLRNFAAYWLY